MKKCIIHGHGSHVTTVNTCYTYVIHMCAVWRGYSIIPPTVCYYSFLPLNFTISSRSSQYNLSVRDICSIYSRTQSTIRHLHPHLTNIPLYCALRCALRLVYRQDVIETLAVILLNNSRRSPQGITTCVLTLCRQTDNWSLTKNEIIFKENRDTTKRDVHETVCAFRMCV